ncbi:septum formation protein Maf [Cohnella kolymensis]|uniref:dTTP/UTP pyrophosphatase n=1 Tax=Cohnella kolymensis TaxID=1590652 RepID=A0ABR5A5R3_9BACL|nr:Maf family protein [Cohnella kolymensis]KIL36406.1 septum formation protein Maf [Cohnella kolymensis]
MSSASPGRPALILASSSPRRQELIKILGLPLQVVPSQADEDTPKDWTPVQIVEGLARRKAGAVIESLAEPSDRDSIVVGSDTIVVLDDKVMGKPKDEEEARNMLHQLAGRTHEVFTGVSCVRPSDGLSVTSHRITRVRMRSLTEEQIARYVATGESKDKAGAYGIQELGALLVDSIEGDYFNVVGLPLSLLAVQLEQFGVSLP